MSLKILKTRVVQGLLTFTFCVVTVNDKHKEPRIKKKRRG